MNILILHKISYSKIEYHLGIDHAQHSVTYIGTQTSIENIPVVLPCKKVIRAGKLPVHIEVIASPELRDERFDRVISLSEYELTDAAIVREHFGIPGSSVADVTKVRNKVVMKDAVEAAGLRVPRFLSLTAVQHDPFAVSWTGSTVVKPIDGAKSEDVRVFDTPHAMLDAVKRRSCGIAKLDLGSPSYERYQVEEFISGPIVHYDGLVCNEDIVLIVGSRYVGTCLEFAQGRPLASYQRPVGDGERTWVQAVLRAVTITAGSFHLEAIEAADGLVFLEVANRFGGADVVSTVELATGVHLPTAELATMTIGDPGFDVEPTFCGEYYGWFVFPGHQLRPDNWSVMGTERFKSSPNIVKWSQLVPDAKLPKDVQYGATESPVSGIARANSAEALQAFLEDLLQSVTVC